MDTAQSRLNQLLEPWTPIDIQEHWDEFTTIQPMQHKTTKKELMVYIRRCEICRSLLWLNFREFNHGTIIEEHRLSTRCSCDDMEDELLAEYDGDTLNTDLPGMWDHSDFLGGPDYNDPSNFNPDETR